MTDRPTLPKPQDWDTVMMRMAFVIASMSKDPTTQVGAVLVSPDRTRISVGYNGFPRRIPDVAAWWHNRQESAGEFSKYDLVRHAEMNAITQAKTDLEGWSLYVTHHPCGECAKNIVAEGIARVFYARDVDSITMPIDHEKICRLFEIGGVQFQQLVVDMT
ncbi:MAG TPA: dCMP deaminase family protein [bacterium]|nr:dCMP deaminase family protein [bacterium]HOX86673.1 dCMP deaminase family protein [bacterium]HPG46136.1 dCMP deaminase family protein [bacterium]HPM98235.1 dCMP deaminase family protein [bacterium]